MPPLVAKPLALPPHIPILRIPSHGVEVFGAVPPGPGPPARAGRPQGQARHDGGAGFVALLHTIDMLHGARHDRRMSQSRVTA